MVLRFKQIAHALRCEQVNGEELSHVSPMALVKLAEGLFALSRFGEFLRERVHGVVFQNPISASSRLL